ncbi:MAG: hypothetical protein MJ152_04180 [Clostridia bacterium]|nr:hypothetical protein [Clostridia bacterium]
MPRDFKTFAKENKKVLDENVEKSASLQEMIDKYKNMNSGELMSNLLGEASKLKGEGKLNADSLSSLKSTLTPFLNSQQIEMLNSLINAINEQK